MPLFWATPSNATQTALAEAQQQLAVAQQELSSASAALQLANASVSAATIARDEAQVSYSAALAAWEATKVTISGTTTTTTQNVVQNGTFDSTANWSSVMASNTVYTGGASPIIYNGKLKGSYSSGFFILQTGTFPAPTRQVTFAVDVWNYDTNEGNRVNNPDYYRIEFRTYAADGTRLNYYNFQWSQWHNEWITRGATYTLDRDAVTWDIGFRMADNGYWAGAFGPEMDNVRLIATMETTTPDTYTYGEAETQAKNAAQQALQTAQAELDSAIAAQTAATARLDAAIDEVVRLTNLVEDFTPHLNAPTGLTAVINGDNVDLSWNAPQTNSSGVQVERYAIMWSIDNFNQTGWAWVHDLTSVSIPLSILDQYGGLGKVFQFAIRADNNTEAIYSAKSNIVSLQTTAPSWWMISFNEGDLVSIGAPEGYVFANATAWYGSPTDVSCGATVSDAVNQVLSGNSSASFYADNGMFGDTCGGVVKVLRMSTPVVPEPTSSPTASPTPTQSPTVSPEPTESPTTSPQPTESPTASPEPSQSPGLPPLLPNPQPVVPPSLQPIEPSPEPTPTPNPEPTPTPEPTPDPTPEPSPQPEPTPTPEPTPLPETEPSPQPSPEPSPTQPVEEPKPTPSPEPSQKPTEGPTPVDKPTEKPTVPTLAPEPTPSITPTPSVPEKEPTPTEKPVVVEIKEPITAENITAVVEELATIEPQKLTEEQQTLIVEAALQTFESAQPGSEEYEAALDALLVVAQADDIVLDEELAAIPLIGNVAGAAVEVFNALGNAGADMSPQVREQSEKVVIAAVIVGQVAMTAVASATSAASVATRRP